MSYRRVGDAVVEWDDSEPLRFTLRGESGPQDGREVRDFTIDLTDLKAGYTQEFLNKIIEHLIARCYQLALPSVKSQASHLKSLLLATITLDLFDRQVGVIDEDFLLTLARERASLPRQGLRYLRMMFTADPHAPLFSTSLVLDDFPTSELGRSRHADLMANILSKALSRAAAAHILNVCDTAYANGEMDIGHYSFVHLAFAVFVRPNSYRQIQLGDLIFDLTSNKYHLNIVASKSRQAIPSKHPVSINEPLGVLLTKQRQNVVETYGHLVANQDLDKLALFPAKHFSSQRFGMEEYGSGFDNSYARAIQRKHFDNTDLTLGANALRHTVGTWLAQSGASAKTIASVLKHATDFVCRAYVDIAFRGMVDDLSEAMRPAFTRHLPNLHDFRSKSDPISAEALIRAENLDTGQTEDIGECGRAIACAYAPIVCYGCFRFRPCWDADHRINLNTVEQEIEDMRQRGPPFLPMLERAKIAKQHILLVMNAADRYEDAMQQKAKS